MSTKVKIGLTGISFPPFWGFTASQYRRRVGEFKKLAASLGATVAATPVPPRVAAVELPSAPESANDFWSLANLEAAQRERQPVEGRTTSRYRLHWDSPVKMPRVEENL